MEKLRVLVIDDSAYNRQTLAEILESDPSVEVVGKAFDGEEGLKLAATLNPDLITLDIEMPRMDGFTFLRILMRQMPTPVIVISSHSRKEEVFQALELGALDFIAKPTHHISPDIANLRGDLLAKVNTVRALRRLPGTTPRRGEARPSTSAGQKPAPAWRDATRVICLGASTGGPPAIESLFRSLPLSETTAFLVAQHMPEKFTRAFAERLNRMVALHVVEAEEGAPIYGGKAYVAPGGSHMIVQPTAAGYEIRLRGPAPGDRYVPSIDMLFASAAEHFGTAVMAVVLTGMGCDGRSGIEAVRAAHGLTVAESEESAVVFGMPKEAILSGCVDETLPLQSIGERMLAFYGNGPVRARRSS